MSPFIIFHKQRTQPAVQLWNSTEPPSIDSQPRCILTELFSAQAHCKIHITIIVSDFTMDVQIKMNYLNEIFTVSHYKEQIYGKINFNDLASRSKVYRGFDKFRLLRDSLYVEVERR